MYTAEDAAVHKKIMTLARQEMKKPRQWSEFRKLQKEVKSIHGNHFDKAAQNHQSSWEDAFVGSLHQLHFRLVLIANHGITKRLRCEAKAVFDELSKIIDKLAIEREALCKVGQDFILSLPQQRYWLGRLKRACKTERSPRCRK